MTVHTPVTGDDVVTTFRAATDQHGLPAATLTDNGMVFTTRFLHGPNGFERELVIHGIEQKNGRPNHPQTQGKVERFQQTLKKWLRAQPPAATPADLQTQLDTFRDLYNTTRPHRSLDNHTPDQAYTTRAKATPTGNSGHWRLRHDKVDKTGRAPCATADACTTSAWATSTTAPPCASSSTTCTSPWCTPTPARSSAT